MGFWLIWQCFSLEICIMIWIFVLVVCELCRNFDYISLSFESRAALMAALVTIPGVFTQRSSHRATRKQDHQREVRRQRERQRRERKERRQAMKKAKKLRKERRKLKRNKGVECPGKWSMCSPEMSHYKSFRLEKWGMGGMGAVWELISPQVDLMTKIGEALENFPEIENWILDWVFLAYIANIYCSVYPQLLGKNVRMGCGRKFCKFFL